ncbi:MAG: T9SS type A sorting domain-containing protein [Flavobacteriales bacterium]|nr:T9SS type A sorting domain-containing protein [Flavobacteriales bacterium]
MSFPYPLFRSILVTLMVLSAFGSKAQVFIPDTIERMVLNQLIPGIVDDDGIMDTLHPAIDELQYAVMYVDTIEPQLDTCSFISVRYLDSLETLIFSCWYPEHTYFSIDGFPEALRTLLINAENTDNAIDLHDLPSGLESLEITAVEADVRINAMPDSLFELSAHVNALQWPGQAKVGYFTLAAEGASSDDVTVPAVITNKLDLVLGHDHPTVDMTGSTVDSVEIITNHVNGTGFDVAAWPEGLSKLRINLYDLNGSFCLAPFPESLTSADLSNLAQVDGFCFPNWPASFNSIPYTTNLLNAGLVSYCSVLNSTCPGAYAGISGRVFIDLDGDGQYGIGEPPAQHWTVEVQPDNYLAGATADGTWEVGVQPGSYTVALSSGYPYYQAIAPAVHTADLPAIGMADSLNNFAVTLIPGIEDLQAQLYADPARPGFNNRLFLSCHNYGTVPMDAQLVLNFDSDQSWVESSIPPGTLAGHTATWDFPELAMGATVNLTVDLATAESVPLGTPINHLLSALPANSDATPLDNLSAVADSVVGSYDPNDKLLSPATMTPAELQLGGTPITYTVRFQNTGTYLAERVVVADTLPEGLQVPSIRLLAASHAYQWYVDHGVLLVIFDGINLPDSTSDEPNSHGFVRFSNLPETDLPNGTDVVNIAHIVFDYNTPIITPPAVFLVDDLSSVVEHPFNGLRVFPNPAQDKLWLVDPHQRGLVDRFQLKDPSGRIIRSGVLGPDGAVNVGGLTAGTYMITTFGPLGKATARFVKW